jgi:hypothetical protein
MVGRDEEAEHDAQHHTQAPGLCHSIGFQEHPWGQMTRDFIWSAKRLKRQDWREITDACRLHPRAFRCYGEEFEGDYYPDKYLEKSRPYSLVKMDW